MTYPIHPGPFFRAAPNWGKPAKHSLFLRTFSKRTDVLTVRSLFSISIMAPWGKPFNLWTSWVDSFWPRVPSWLWIRWIQSASHRNNFTSPPILAMSTATQNFAQTSSYFIPGQHFLETCFSPHNNQDHSFIGDYNVPVLNQQTRLLLHLRRPYQQTHTFNNALNLTMHLMLWHLAAKKRADSK